MLKIIVHSKEEPFIKQLKVGISIKACQFLGKRRKTYPNGEIDDNLTISG